MRTTPNLVRNSALPPAYRSWVRYYEASTPGRLRMCSSTVWTRLDCRISAADGQEVRGTWTCACPVIFLQLAWPTTKALFSATYSTLTKWTEQIGRKDNRQIQVAGSSCTEWPGDRRPYHQRSSLASLGNGRVGEAQNVVGAKSDSPLGESQKGAGLGRSLRRSAVKDSAPVNHRRCTGADGSRAKATFSPTVCRSRGLRALRLFGSSANCYRPARSPQNRKRNWEVRNLEAESLRSHAPSPSEPRQVRLASDRNSRRLRESRELTVQEVSLRALLQETRPVSTRPRRNSISTSTSTNCHGPAATHLTVVCRTWHS